MAIESIGGLYGQGKTVYIGLGMLVPCAEGRAHAERPGAHVGKEPVGAATAICARVGERRS